MAPTTLKADFESQGFHLPVRVLSDEEAGEIREKIESLNEASLAALGCPWKQKAHLLFPWLNELIRHPRILATVEAVLGPDFSVLSGDLFIKEPRNPGYISWHQDGNTWNLEPMDTITAWVALTESHEANGCVRFSPGTHKCQQLPHVETFGENNMLTRGQEIAMDIDEATAVSAVLRPGEMSLHQGLLAHASGANTTDSRRIGFAIRYMPTHVKSTGGPRITVTHVHGNDTYGHFAHEERPDGELTPLARRLHHEALAPHAGELFSTV